LGSELQAGLLPLFHYALREEGSLFLGSSETIGRHTRLFAPIDRKHRIFRRRLARFVPRPSFPADIFTQRSRELRDLAVKPTETSPSQWAERVMLAHYAPASIVIDEHFEVVRFSARLARFLDPSAGNATLNVFGLIHPELRWNCVRRCRRRDRAVPRSGRRRSGFTVRRASPAW
jgi:two-component system CheB/CheR fusion protein